MNSAPTDPMIGQTLDGRYVIRSRIARGGMAMVYLATDLRLERRVAVKVMHAHLAEDENFTRRFEQEARSAAGLSHPNLVGVFDQGHDAGRTYLVMEYLPSITLRELLKQQKRLTAEQSIEIGDAVLSGLAAAHASGIVHRDLKPENVLLADDGRIKLGDFGLARAVSANTTTGQALLGTIAYLSPELVTRGVADARSDLYAFGIMLYEMLTGEQPFTGEQPMQIAYQHAHSDVPIPSEKSTEATPELDELVRWTTRRDPEERPIDAGEALEALQALRDGASPFGHTRALPTADDTAVLASPETTVLQPASTTDAHSTQHTDPIAPASPVDRAVAAAQRRRKRGLVTAAAAAAAAVLAAGAGWWFGQGPGSLATVPEVVGFDISEATQLLEQQDLRPEVFDCPSLTVAAGQAARTEPAAGERLDRGTQVRLCRSIGPEQLAVPTLVGLDLRAAEQAITDAGFTFGEVVEERFDAADRGIVIAALDESGAGLGETYAEQAPVDLIVSAGEVPAVAGLSVDDATAALAASDLTVDGALADETHSDEVPEGHVVELVLPADIMRPGDSVGLRLSLGPELFAVPDVSGLTTVGEAMDTLTAAGFAPSVTGVDGIDRLSDRLLRRLPFDGLEPASGTMLPLGSTVKIQIF